MAPIQRNTTIDLARLLASIGVIAIHVHNSTPAALAIGDFVWPLCVPFFYAVSLTYFVAGLQKASLTTIFTRAWTRLITPYLVWTLIYTALLLTKYLLGGSHHTFSWWRILFYGESAVHLYFLPALLLQQAFALSCFLLFTPSRRQLGAGLALLAGATAYLAWGITNQLFMPGQILATGAYLAVAFWLAPQLAEFRQRWGLAILGLLLIISAIGSTMAGLPSQVLGYPMVLPMGGVGLLLLTFGLSKKTLSSPLLFLTSLSFGIYLSHVAFLEAFELVTERMWPPTGLYYTWVVKLMVVAMIFAVAALFTWLANRYAIGRRLLLGERA